MHHPDIPFYLLLTDRCDGYFDPAQEPFELIEIEDLGLPVLERLASGYGQQALSYALTPHLLRYLLNQGFEGALFLKQETLVLGDLSGIFGRLAHAPLLLTPHLLEPSRGQDPIRMELDVLRAGVYNGGVVFAAKRQETVRFLSWWARQMEERCELQIREGYHYEQRWLDFAPSWFGAACIIRHPGVNVGHWNLSERTIRVEGDAVFANDEPCLVFRFSGYDPDFPQRITKYHPHKTTCQFPGVAVVFERYRQALIDEGYEITRHWPYAFEPVSGDRKEGVSR